MRVGVFYYSGTGVTRGYAELLRDRLAKDGVDAVCIDVTPAESRGGDRGPIGYDAVIFGFPVFADFPPKSFSAWISSIEGRGVPAAAFATYGGRTSGYANYHATRLLRARGFKVLLAAEFLGKHTFNAIGWNLAPDRPDSSDLETAESFASLAAALFSRPDARELLLQKPFGYDAALAALESRPAPAERKWSTPFRVDSCSLCGSCERDCPTAAMDARRGFADPALCEECLRCLVNCPERALHAEDARFREFFPTFMREYEMTEETVAHKRSKIIRSAWDAPS